MPLIVTGTVGIDSVYTPGGHAEKVLGGSCTYFAAAASFYAPVRVVAAVGGDFTPAYRKVFSRFPAIDLAGLEVRPGSKTFAWGGRYHENMNSRETLFTELGVLAEAPPKVPPAYADSRFVFLANTHPAVQLDLLAQFPARRLAVADTMDLWINTARPELEKLLKKIDGLVLNYDEAELLTGLKNPVAAARAILKAHAPRSRTARGGLRFVVVKKGEHGCLFVHRDGIGALPAFPADKVVDPTGAGDSFAGGMMGSLAARCSGPRGKSVDPGDPAVLRTALAHGTVVASFNIESFTLSRLMKLRKDEITARFKHFADLTAV